jgi:uncharacterized protein YcfL
MKVQGWSIILSLMLASLPAAAQTINSKVEVQGTPRHVQISGLTAREQNGLLSLYLEFQNTDNADQEAYYRVTWLDDGGFPVWNEEAWKPVLIHGNLKEKIVVISPNVKARDFKIQFSAEKNWANTSQ